MAHWSWWKLARPSANEAFALALGSLLFGCFPEHGEPARPKVGDQGDGGTIVNVAPVGTTGLCYSVTVEAPSPWQCTEEQKQIATGAGATTTPTTTATTSEEAVDLAVTDCDGLAALRRPAFKVGYYAQLEQQRRSQLLTNCFGKRTSYLANSEGERVAACPTPPVIAATPTGRNANASPPNGPVPTSQPAPQSPSPGMTSGAQPPATVSGGHAVDGAAAEPDPGGGASEVSTTNTQVRGVDEPDFVKNDTEHVYVLSPRGLHVIDAWPAEETREIAQISVPGEPRRMFLEGDVLAVYSKVTSGPTYDPYGRGAAGQNPSYGGCTYGYDCRYSSEGGRTVITLFDVSNPAAPTEIHRYELSGGFVAARRVGQYVYTVVHDTGATQAPPVTVQITADSAEELDRSYAANKQAIEDAIDELPSEYFLPWLTEQPEAGGDPVPVESCDSALASRAAAGMSFVSLVSFDLDTLAPPSRSIIAGRPGFVYSSADALYLAADGVAGVDSLPTPYYGAAEADRSTIHKFALEGATTRYVGSDSIRGHVLNQFSMDEFDGVLRVATSSGRVPSPDVSSNVTTLREGDEGFARYGELTGLAPQEDIRSVRFDGDQGFIVTFKKTDPLFVIDLSAPEAPSVLGELKIPGFSTYMHRLDSNHLLAVGFDADDQGSFAYFDGIQIQIFDITDLSNPTLLHKTVIGTRGSGSEALMNHLAFNFYGPKRLLGLPMTICEGGDNGVYGDELTFSGLMVFDVSLEDGITERGRMPFVDIPAVAAEAAAPQAGGATPTPTTPAATCGTWWTNSTSLVKRSIFMENFALGISDTTVNVASLSALSNVLSSVSLMP